MLRFMGSQMHRQVWVSLLGHCSFLLGPGAQGSVSTLQGSADGDRQPLAEWAKGPDGLAACARHTGDSFSDLTGVGSWLKPQKWHKRKMTSLRNQVQPNSAHSGNRTESASERPLSPGHGTMELGLREKRDTGFAFSPLKFFLLFTLWILFRGTLVKVS